jgi:hypothetical protein
MRTTRAGARSSSPDDEGQVPNGAGPGRGNGRLPGRSKRPPSILYMDPPPPYNGSGEMVDYLGARASLRVPGRLGGQYIIYTT